MGSPTILKRVHQANLFSWELTPFSLPQLNIGQKDNLGNNRIPSQEQLFVPLETYENAFSEIRKVTGISDIGELVQRFIAVEDQNFSLFNYVNEINNEIELHAEEVVALQAKLNSMKVEAVEAEEERKTRMGLLEVYFIRYLNFT